MLSTRDIDYTHDGTRMSGYLVAADSEQRLPTILLIHDAFGLGEEMAANAERFARLGFAVFAADVWGERRKPSSESEIGSFIGGMVADRSAWLARIAAAHEAAAAQPEVDSNAIVAAGYCFGGSSALEHARTGGGVRGVISFHAGLDLLASDWSAAESSTRVLVTTGADDPMATAEQRAQLQTELSGAGIDWQVDLYSDTKHAFTNPKSDAIGSPHIFSYNARSTARAWASAERFLHELFPTVRTTAG
jgi:dienelactone hydrolase